MMRRVTVIGARGQLGSDLVAVLMEQGDYDVIPLTRDEIDCTAWESVRRSLEPLRADVVVNCAAFVRVDECEERPEEAFRVNAVGALYVARWCAEGGADCVHVSTDYVFDGTHGSAYTEDDVPRPLNVYGASKLSGEFLVRSSTPRWLIVRTASLFGQRGSRAKGGNFVDMVLRRARAGEPLRIINDIRMSPTYTLDLAHALAHLVRDQVTGIVHAVNRGSCTWFEFAQTALRLARVEARIEPVPSSAVPMMARRPADSSLTTVRLTASAGEPLRPWQEALRAYLAERSEADGA